MCRAPDSDSAVIVLTVLQGQVKQKAELVATALAQIGLLAPLFIRLRAAVVQEQQKEIEQRKQELQVLLGTKEISQEAVTVLIAQ